MTEHTPKADSSIERNLFIGGSLLSFGLILGGSIIRRRVERVFGLRATLANISKEQVSPYFTDPHAFFRYGNPPRTVSNIQRVDLSHQSFDVSFQKDPAKGPSIARYSQKILFPSKNRHLISINYSTMTLAQFQADIRIDIAPDDSQNGTQIKLIGSLVAPWLVANTALQSFQKEEQSRLEAIESALLNEPRNEPADSSNQSPAS